MSATKLQGRQIAGLGGDISGTGDAVSVNKIKGTPISATAPTTGDVLTFDGSQWKPQAGGGGSLTGSGTPGKLAKWTGGTALGDSVISELAGTIGVGRAPTAVDGPNMIEAQGQIVAVGDGVTNFATLRAISYGGENGSSPVISLYSANGTEGTPVATQAGDQIGFIGVKGFDGTAFGANGSRAAIQMIAEETFTPTAQGTSMRLRVTAPGSVSNTNAIVIKAASAGLSGTRVGFANMNPQATVDIAGTLKFADGNQGSGKVLTSDGSGNASWQTPSGGSADFNRIVTAGGNVVVGNDGNVVFI